MARLLPLARLAASLATLYAGAALLGLGLLVAGFQFGALGSLDILFYRGLVMIALAAVPTLAILALGLRRWGAGLSTRDAFAATIVSAALSVSFLVVVPVTADRSISVFLLGEMATQSDAITPDEASELFKSVYVDDYRQIDRRLREQAVSGNAIRIGNAYRITKRGRLVVAVSQGVARLFGSRTDIAAPRAVDAHDAFARR